MPEVETVIPPGSPEPIGPYSHIAKVGPWITIGGVGGIAPATGALAGKSVEAQTRQILANFAEMLASVGSDLAHVVHVNVFLRHMSDFDTMNKVYAEVFGPHRPARTVIGVDSLPIQGCLLTMNLTAVTRSGE